MFENRFLQRVAWKLACLLLLPLCMLCGLVRAWPQAAGGGMQPTQAEPPSEWNGRPLRPLALGPAEERFARAFPGTLMRLTDGREVLVLRSVDRPTRMLHPATDCYRALGYRIAAERLQQQQDGGLWRCFEALRDGRALRVCERIVDAQGRGFTDASSWYWAALMGESQGPWQALTVASPS